MSAKISSIQKDVIKTKFAKIEKNSNIFNEDEHISFLNFCKQISEANFQNKSLQTSNGSNKLGKSMLFEKKKFFCLHNYNYFTYNLEKTMIHFCLI